jgi:serine/threonine protein phosphatase 1
MRKILSLRFLNKNKYNCGNGSMGKIFAIGDIHGCLKQLQTLMKSLEVDRENDLLIFIGDYIDRGDSPKNVMDFIIELRDRYKNIVFLMGNHEQMFLRYLDGIDEELYLGNGGMTTLLDYGISRSRSLEARKEKIPEEHLHFFHSLLPYYETDDYIFVHAGLQPGLPLGQQTVYDLLWIRHEFIDSEYDFCKRVVFGHTHLGAPLIMPNKIGIDTGAVYGGPLTCVELPAVKLYQV